jgi:hypothetical protein
MRVNCLLFSSVNLIPEDMKEMGQKERLEFKV